MHYGATTDAPGGFIPEQTDSEARGQAEWADGIAWLDDPVGVLATPAGALAVALRATFLGLWGPQEREKWRW